jgi:glucosamine kinase
MGEFAHIGVDGGGTGCRLALVRGKARFETKGGPCNVSTDTAGALRELSAGLDRLAAQSGLDRGAVRALPICLGLAGVVTGDPRPDVTEALRLGRARVLDDRAVALRGALGSRDGALVGLGTGSFFALQQGGQVRLAGGWGLRLGDEASGAWLGREILRYTLEVVDGLERESLLTETLLARLAGPAGIVAFSLSARPQDYAAFAPEIVAAAEAGDFAGREIMRRGRAHVVATLEGMGWHAGMPLVLAGGLAESYKPHLPSEFQGALAAPEASPLDGALALAAEMAREMVS